MTRWLKLPILRLFGSLPMAVVLIVLIAIALGVATVFEARFGPKAVQHYFYQAWWFHGLLGFLIVNLVVAVFIRLPLKRHQTGFVLAHIGIICLLMGGLLGKRFGIIGQMIIPEGQFTSLLEIDEEELLIHLPNPGSHQVFSVNLASRPWQHAPRLHRTATLDGRPLSVEIDTYFPDARLIEELHTDDPTSGPAILLELGAGPVKDEAWLFASDPDRLGFRWQEAHVMFFAIPEHTAWQRFLTSVTESSSPGILRVKLPDDSELDIPVSRHLNRPLPLGRGPYVMTIHRALEFARVTPQGLLDDPEGPRNPAVVLSIEGPRGNEQHVVFSLHPDQPTIHPDAPLYPLAINYHTQQLPFPPGFIGIFSGPDGQLQSVVTSPQREHRTNSLAIGQRYEQPWLGYQFQLKELLPHAKMLKRWMNQSLKAQSPVIHVRLSDGLASASAWVPYRSAQRLTLGRDSIDVEYRPKIVDLGLSVKLIDFRKVSYPGTDVVKSFESDVELHDSLRNVTLPQTISMNRPLGYRGYTFYQDSYIEEPIETTVLSVRRDPGVPFVYVGFVFVVGGILAMFYFRKGSAQGTDPRQVVG